LFAEVVRKTLAAPTNREVEVIDYSDPILCDAVCGV
jgi:hypothetical protein